MLLDGNITLISGGAGLIGGAFSSAIVEHGGKVIIGDTNAANSKKIAKTLGAANAAFIHMDCTDPHSIAQAVDFAERKFGHINSAVHCAYPRSKGWGAKFEDLEACHLAEDLSAQLGGAIMFSQVVLKTFVSNGKGNLVHISSIQGLSAPKFEHYQGTAMSSPIEYAAIKAGVISITKYIAKYYQNKGIRSNCISPGGILDGQPDEFLRRYRNSCSSKGMLDPSDLCQTLIFLLSEHSQYINGQNIVIDDGWSL